MMSFTLSWSQIVFSFFIGVALSFGYLVLLWLTIRYLKHVRLKTPFLLGSAAVRIALFLFIAFLFSDKNPLCFLSIFIGFSMTRFIILSQVKSLTKEPS